MNSDFTQINANIKQLAKEIGFDQIGITSPKLLQTPTKFQKWLEKGYQGEMEYLTRNIDKRNDPTLMFPEIKSVICCAVNYYSDTYSKHISRYALGRDYHKIIKKMLHELSRRIEQQTSQFNCRCFVDSAPVFEKHFAMQSGIGWQGKNCLIINENIGSWFCLGTIYCNLDLVAVDPAVKPRDDNCGNCTKCIESCPTDAIVEPYVIDARRCIAYLTIEHKGAIPLELRPKIGTQIYGCDICQAACPWNKTRQKHGTIFQPRPELCISDLITFFSWTEQEFLKKLQGSAIRRIGYESWLRNIAVALGNSPYSPDIVEALKKRRNKCSDMVNEHIKWALNQQ